MDQAQAIKRERARAVHKGESERAILSLRVGLENFGGEREGGGKSRGGGGEII